ncbi:MAG: hypothetical protein F6J92_10505, partial [Symploca sp. SIO1A3]|nr:hypothetical protein [Symploca sp. SIO1A3]
MGSSMAANLARSGYSVTAWNRTPHRPGLTIRLVLQHWQLPQYQG